MKRTPVGASTARPSSHTNLIKKALSLFLSLIMLISVVACVDLSAYAVTSSGTCGDNLTWEYDTNTGVLTISGNGNMADYLSATPWNNLVSSIKAVDIKYGVTSIGNWAFDYCTSLSSITIPNSVTGIGENAFNYCTSLTSVTMPNSVISIGSYAFHNCDRLTSVTIPNSVRSIGEGPFSCCDGLTSIYVDSQNPYYASQKGVLFNKNKKELIQYPASNARTSYIIPNSVTSIGSEAFYGCDNLTNITIPNSVISIDENAFIGCDNLTNITIPNSVTSIGRWAFSACYSLTNVTIGNGVTSIGDNAFSNCDSLTSVTIPNSVRSIGEVPFSFCDNLTSIYVGSQNPYYASQNGVLFNKDKIKLIQYPAGNTRKAYTIPNSVISIGRFAFCGCDNLTSVIIGNNVTSIGGYVFSCCYSLTSVTIPNSVTRIDYDAFDGCDTLTDVYYYGTKKQWGKITIDNGNESLTNATIHYNYIKSVSLSKTRYTYNGKVKTPSVTVKDSKGNKISSKYYTVTYSKGRKNVGKYTVTIKFKGNYSGTVKKTFTIKPKATSISKLTAGKKKFTVKWKKQATQTTGYQIQYSTSSKFKSAKTVTIGKNKTTSKTVSKLKAKKKYYVRVRTYKVVKFNGKNTKIYSSWSKAKAVTTKK